MGNLDFLKTYDDLKKIHIGERISKRREELGLTLKEASSALEIPYVELASYEYGALEIYMDMLWRISRLLNKSPSYFFEGLENIPLLSGIPEDRE